MDFNAGTWSDSVLAELEFAGQNPSELYLLIDQSALPDLDRIWPKSINLIWRAVLGANDKLGEPTPILVQLPHPAGQPISALTRFLQNLYDQGHWANCISLMSSSWHFDQLVGALHERTKAQLPENLAVILRYFDTRVLPLLPQLLKPAQQQLFISCVQKWQYLDRNGNLQNLFEQREQPSEVKTFEPLIFDEAQETMLVQDGLSDAVIDQLLAQRHPALFDCTPPEQFKLVDGIVQSGRLLGFDDVIDLTLYCYAAFEHGNDFAKKEPWATDMKRARSGQIKLEEALGYA